MIVTLFPIFRSVYLCRDHLSGNRYNHFFYKFCTISIQIFLEINRIPNKISHTIKNCFLLLNHLSKCFKNALYFTIVLHILLIISGIEVNPGPVLSKKTKLPFAVWNLDSIPARDFARIPLIETFQATYDFDLFGVCESLLNKYIAKDDISMNGFSPEPLRADKPGNVRNGGVCLYFKEHLLIKERCDLEILPETIVAEIKLNRKKKCFLYFLIAIQTY